MRGGATRISRSSVGGVPATMDAVIKIMSDLRSKPPSCIRLGEVCRLFGSTKRSRDRRLYLHYGVLDCQQHRVCCSSLDEQCGDILYYELYLHSLSLCREGIHWSINGTQTMEMGLELFCFPLNLWFCFRSLSRFDFPKKARRETKN